MKKLITAFVLGAALHLSAVTDVPFTASMNGDWNKYTCEVTFPADETASSLLVRRRTRVNIFCDSYSDGKVSLDQFEFKAKKIISMRNRQPVPAVPFYMKQKGRNSHVQTFAFQFGMRPRGADSEPQKPLLRNHALQPQHFHRQGVGIRR